VLSKLLQKKITKIIWKSCPLTNDIITVLSERVRHEINQYFSFTGNCVIPHNLTHDFVEVHIECEDEKCKNEFKTVGDEKKHKNCYCCTFEYGSTGTSKEVGRYENWFEGRKSFVPKNFRYNYLLLIFRKYEKIFLAKDYDLLKHNYKTFASAFYSELEDMDANFQSTYDKAYSEITSEEGKKIIDNLRELNADCLIY
jgi:hypothetical protein